MAEARRETVRFTELHSALVANVDLELRKRNLRPNDRGRRVLGLVQAGVPISAAEAAAEAARPPAPREARTKCVPQQCRILYHHPLTLGWALEELRIGEGGQSARGAFGRQRHSAHPSNDVRRPLA